MEEGAHVIFLARRALARAQQGKHRLSRIGFENLYGLKTREALPLKSVDLLHKVATQGFTENA